jgi:hypothetical protein
MNAKTDPALHPDDAAALDRLVEADYQPDVADPAGADPRLAQVSAVLRRLDALESAEPGDDLTDRTLSRIQQAIDAEQRDRRVGPGGHTWWSNAVRKVSAAAAVVALGLLAVWPVLNQQDEALGPAIGTVEQFEAGFSMPGQSAADWRAAAEMPLTEANAPQINVENVQGYSGPVTVQFRWMSRTLTQPDGAQVQVWQPVLVVVPLEQESASQD